MEGRNTSLILKGCPKCKGDLKLTRDSDGAFISCLQCGLLRDVSDGSVQAKLPRIETRVTKNAA